MESPTKQMMLIVYMDGWYIVNAKDMVVISGPWETHEDAKAAMKIVSHRLKLGWSA